MLALCLRDNRFIPAALLARTLAPFLAEVHAADASRALRYSSGVLLRRLDEATARAALEALRAENVDALLADEAAAGPTPRPRKAMSAEPVEDALALGLGHEGNLELVARGDLRALFVAAVPVALRRERERREIATARGEREAERLQARIAAFEAEAKGRALELSIELYCASPPRYYRLLQRETSYRALGGGARRLSLPNFVALLGTLATFAKDAFCPPGTRAFIALDDLDAVRFEKREELSSYRDWLHLTLSGPCAGPPA